MGIYEELFFPKAVALLFETEVVFVLVRVAVLVGVLMYVCERTTSVSSRLLHSGF